MSGVVTVRGRWNCFCFFFGVGEKRGRVRLNRLSDRKMGERYGHGARKVELFLFLFQKRRGFGFWFV